jgi:DNA-binding MarR family transcriptional regulator
MTIDESVTQIVDIFSKMLKEAKEEALNTEELNKITLPQLRYVEAIARLNNPTFGALTDYLGVSKASVTSIVELLINAGYVEKVRSTTDSRLFYLSLTAKGEKLVNAEIQSRKKFIQKITDTLSEQEIQHLNTIFGKIIHSFK